MQENIFIFGNQEFEINEKLKQLKTKLVQEHSCEEGVFSVDIADYNLAEFFRKEEIVQELRNTCEAISFLSSFSIVEIKNLQALKINKNDSQIDLSNLLLSYFEDIPKDTVFVVSALIKKTSELPSKIQKLLKANFKEIKTIVSYDNYRPVDWVIKKGVEFGIQFDRETASLLIDLAGKELSILNKEIEKLSIDFGENHRLSKKEVFDSTASEAEISSFQIVDVIVERNFTEVVKRLDSILKNDPYQVLSIVALIVSHFRKLFRIKSYLKHGHDEGEVIRLLKLNPWMGKQWIGQSKSFNLNELSTFLVNLSQNDLRLKYSGEQSKFLFEKFVSGLIYGEYKRENPIKLNWVEPVY